MSGLAGASPQPVLCVWDQSQCLHTGAREPPCKLIQYQNRLGIASPPEPGVKTAEMFFNS